MWIKCRDYDRIINSQQVMVFDLFRRDKYQDFAITAQPQNTKVAVPMASYKLKRTAQSVINLIWDEIEKGTEYYVLPEDGDTSLSYSDGITHTNGYFNGKHGYNKTNGKTK